MSSSEVALNVSRDRRNLSDRERAVLALAAAGLTDKEIADHLKLATSTVKSYWIRIRQKTGGLNRTQAVASNFQAQHAEIAEREAWLRAIAQALNLRAFIVNVRGRVLFAAHPDDSSWVGEPIESLIPTGTRLSSPIAENGPRAQTLVILRRAEGAELDQGKGDLGAEVATLRRESHSVVL